MVVDCIKLLFAKHKGSESAEEDRLGIQLFNFERCCRIAAVATGQATRENTVQSSRVSRDSGEDCAAIAPGSTDRRIPTCSACLENAMWLSNMAIGEIDCQ